MTLRLLIAAAVLAASLSIAHAQPFTPTITTMGNGLTVILVEDHATPLVGIDVWVKAGTSHETPKNNGVSHFIEHMLFGSTTKRDAGDMDLEMESIGATLDAHTSRDWAHFNTTVSTRYLPKALDVMADVLSNAQFRDIELERERAVLLEEIASRDSDPINVCKDAIAAEVFGTHPYALPIEGTAQTIRAIKRQDILDYYHKYYVPKNTAIILVGDIDPQRVLGEVGKVFQGYNSAPAPDGVTPTIEPIDKQRTQAIETPFKQVYLVIGFLGPPGTDYTDVCATDVLLAYLGFGYRSWMSDELKDKMGVATEVSADYLTQRQRGMITVFAATDDAGIDKAKGAIFAKIASIRTEGITEPNISAAKRSLLGQYAFQNETYGGLANSCGFYFAVSEADFAARYEKCVQAVTNADITRVAEKFLDPARAVVLVARPRQGGAR